MSYILEALRKAERERAGSAVPSTATEHQLPAPPARPRWPWVLGAALVLNVLLAAGLIAILRQPGPPAAPRDVPGAAGPVAAGPATAPVPTTAQAPAPTPAQGTAPAATTALPQATTPVQMAVPPTTTAPTRTSAPATETAAPSPPMTSATPGPAAAPPSTASRAPAVMPGRAAPLREARTAPPPPAGPVPSAHSGPGASPPIIERPAVGSASGPRSAAPVGSPPAASPPRPAPSPEPATAAVPSGAAPAGASRYHLDVHVYSETAASRIVFVNGQKYVEGQRIDEHTVLEAITAEGAVLNQQGQRLVLRP